MIVTDIKFHVVVKILTYNSEPKSLEKVEGGSCVVDTHWVVNVDPLGRVGLHKLAINEQLGGGLRDHRGA